MEIKYKNFEIEINEHSFDLYQTRQPKQFHKVKDKDNVKVWHGYFSNMENAVKKIIIIELSKRDEIVDLRNFLALYKAIWNDITTTINVRNV